MGKKFRRDRNSQGSNALLNYGYAVLRAATARAIVSSGLHPSLSVHHKSGGDPLALADDLMEPFRPTTDLAVHKLLDQGIETVEEGRTALVDCLSASFQTKDGNSPLSQVLVRLVQSLSRSFDAGKADLVFPLQPLPDEETQSD